MTDTLTARRLAVAAAAVAAVLLVATAGFHAVEHESWLDAFYRSVVTVSLTGIDTPPRHHAGLALTILLVLAGVTIFAWVAAALIETISRSVAGDTWREKRRRREIEGLRDHTIICGYGRVGRRIADELRAAGESIVVLDFNPEAIAVAREHGDPYVEGSGTEDTDLEAAGLLAARALVTAADDDAANLYVTLSARAARPDLLIVARGSDEEAEKKLKLAGADRVVLPYATAGRVMANLVVKPQVAAFVSMVTSSLGPDLRFEQIEVPGDWADGGQPIRDLHVRSRTGATIIAVQKVNGAFEARPSGDTVIDGGDVVVGVGSSDEIAALERMLAAQGAVAR